MRIYFRLLQALVVTMFVAIAFPAQATPQTGYFIYDEAGHLIGEYDSNGTVIQEHIYLGDRPVAVVQGQTGSVGYVTADQLNTPRAVTVQNATLEWSWTSDPFGNGQPTGSLTYNLRFPGQYFDSETGHNYNYFRDYDASTGRYIESDPAGINGGIDTYAYAFENPLTYMDMRGLDPCPPGSSPSCYRFFVPKQQPLPMKPETQCQIQCNIEWTAACSAATIGVAFATGEIGGWPGLVTGGGCALVKAIGCHYHCKPNTPCDGNK